ncbi:uncharacterized protein LOC126656717 [Mercurialis annua]|uniref:uncharacterized protein LOC126656717 n=1 Tax=Mercurialis annua TaxID=3986 RepID=UPI00215EE528|nr:uncharacterized protein LOC126656717 [Mercurialis annua]
MSSSGAKYLEDEVLMGALLYRKSSMDLLQNCDLPPPLKVFSGPDKTVISSMNRVFSTMGSKEDENINDFDAYGSYGEVLKALRLSQTRAREAEKKAVSLAEEKGCLSNALLRESMNVFAYRQWVRLLDVQVMKLQSELKYREKKRCCCNRARPREDVKESSKEADNGGGGSGGVSWILALVFCLGIAGEFFFNAEIFIVELLHDHIMRVYQPTPINLGLELFDVDVDVDVEYMIQW